MKFSDCELKLNDYIVSVGLALAVGYGIGDGHFWVILAMTANSVAIYILGRRA